MSRKDTPADYVERVADALKGRYDLDRVIGRGGMAVVFLAQDRKLNRPVAVKVVDPQLCSKLSASRFLREVQITAPLQHPNILPLIDSGTVDDIVYAVLPFVEGDTVRDRLLRDGQLAVEDALLWARELAEALEYAHRRGIVHRDVKPENVLISNGAAVITDFGIARATNMAEEATLTSGGMPVGTPAYMSPEQITGREKVDGRADIYSLGCTLYEMLAGRPPFEGAEVHDVLRAHLEQDPPDLARRRPEIGDRVVALVHKAMAKRPADRFQSAGEMAAELRLILGEPPRQPTPPESGGAVLTPTPARRSRPSYLRPQRAGGWLLLAAIAFGALALFIVLRPAGGGATGETSLAVLPFRVEPPTGVPEYVSEGLEDELVRHLAAQRGLRVIAPTSARMMGRSGLAPQQIADSLRVARLMMGQLAPLGDSTVRVTVRITEAGGGTTWQREYRLRPGSARAVAAEIAGDAAVELVGARPRQRSAFLGAPVSDALLQGQYWLARPTPAGITRARAAFASALAEDSTNAEAMAGLARAHHQAALYGFRGSSDLYGDLATAVLLARRAAQLDTANPQVALTLASTALHGGLPRDSVARLFRRALALSPNLPQALLDLAHLESERGRGDTALALAREGLAIDPLSPGVRHSTITLALGERQYGQALEWARSRLAQDPGDLVALALEGYALVLSGRAAECADRDHGPWLAAQALCLHAAGREAEAKQVADSLRGMLEREEYVTVHQFTDLATYHAWTGNPAEALRWLERAAAHGPVIFEWNFTSGLYDRVREQAAFAEGLERLRRQMADRIRARVGMLERDAG